ncbi:MAG: phosphate ABC transporter permease PstA [Alphaproteobacteria bacterium]|nr:MAG: phosphate ABC transporter permease PstA [Alphaproteobacteria bacterium]
MFALATWAAALAVAAVFAAILLDLAMAGASRLSWAFLTSAPADAGRAGGIAPILVATLLILAVALAAAVPLGLGAAAWLAEFTRRGGRAAHAVRLCLDALAGVPSIVFGLFGNAFFAIYLGLGFSILSGGLTLACMILPIFIRTVEAGLASVPGEWRHGAYALGLSRAAALRHLLLPATAPAIAAGLVLGIGRALAETAALLFTSGYVDRMPQSLADSGRALAVHIYDLSMNVTGGDANAYASALILIMLVLAANGTAMGLSDRLLARRMQRA